MNINLKQAGFYFSCLFLSIMLSVVFSFSVDARGNYIPVDSCGVLDQPSTTYVLQNDVSTNGTCFIINADDITLDGQGHNVDGIGSIYTQAIFVQNKENILIKNFNITEFGVGIYFDSVDNSIVENNEITSSSTGAFYSIDSHSNFVRDNYFSDSTTNNDVIVIIEGSGNEVEKNQIFLSGNDGIFIDYESYSNIIRNNSIIGSAFDGIEIDGFNNEIMDNFISEGNRGIKISGGTATGNIVEDNQIVFNTGSGIILEFNANNNELKNNLIDSNEYGIIFFTSFDNLIVDSTIKNSVIDAVYLSSSSSDNNVFVDLIIENTSGFGYDLNIVSGGLDNTTLIDTDIQRYSFNGNTANFVKSNFGEIRFTEEISGDGEALSEDIVIEFNLAKVESDNNPGLNRSAKISLFGNPGENFDNPIILRNGLACPAEICTALTPLDAKTVVFTVSGWTEYSIGESCIGDLNNDGNVNSTDQAILLGSWGECSEETCSSDLNNDGFVNSADLARLLGNWGEC